MTLSEIEPIVRQAKKTIEDFYAKVVQHGPAILRELTGNYSPFDMCMCLGCVWLILFALWPRRRRRSKRYRGDPVLDRKVFEWNRDNPVTVRDLVAGGLHVVGNTGSGKTSSFRQIARAILSYGNSSMLVMCAKRGEYLDWLKLASETHRSRDVILIDPQHKNYINLIGHEATRKGDGAGMPQNVTRFVMNLREVLLRESSSGGGDHHFWKQQDERTICSAVTLLMMAHEDINSANIVDLVLSAPLTQDEKLGATWKNGYCNGVIGEAHSHAQSENEKHDFNACAEYFLSQWPGLGERTRGSVLMGTMATLSPLNTGLARTMFGDRTTFSLSEAIAKRKIILINLWPDEYGSLGQVGNVGIKYLLQQEILRRDVKRSTPFSIIWGDESAQWLTSFDTSYLSRCRSYRGGMIYLTQSLASYRDVLPGERAEASIKALLSNFTMKAIFSLGCPETAQWASTLVGKELQTTHGGSIGAGHFEPFSLFPERGQLTSTFNQAWTELIRPEQFMSGLRTGSPVNDFQCDAFIVRSNGVFANGLPVIKTTFDQRH